MGSPLQIREFVSDDATAVSELIRLTMERSNTSDYPLSKLRPLIDYFTPERVELLSRERFCLVAVQQGRIIGTAAIEGQQVATFFVHPEVQRQGVGTALLGALERLAHRKGLPRLVVEASLTGTSFYEARGYHRTGRLIEGAAGGQIELEKSRSQ
jgi:GNAT superfamily N-acetyltransferase